MYICQFATLSICPSSLSPTVPAISIFFKVIMLHGCVINYFTSVLLQLALRLFLAFLSMNSASVTSLAGPFSVAKSLFCLVSWAHADFQMLWRSMKSGTELSELAAHPVNLHPSHLGCCVPCDCLPFGLERWFCLGFHSSAASWDWGLDCSVGCPGSYLILRSHLLS